MNYEGNAEPYECTIGNTLFKENNKFTCNTTEDSCFEHDLGKLGNRFCKDCIDGYFIDNGHCKSCDQNCIQCSGIGKCTKCAKDYILINGNCQSQTAMRCSKVDDRTICYECESSYNFNNNGDCVLNKDVYCLFERDSSCLKCSTTMIEPYECEQKSADDKQNEDKVKTATIEDSSDSNDNDENKIK